MSVKISVLQLVIFGFILTSEIKKPNKPLKKTITKNSLPKDQVREFSPLDYTKVLKQLQFFVENDTYNIFDLSFGEKIYKDIPALYCSEEVNLSKK